MNVWNLKNDCLKCLNYFFEHGFPSRFLSEFRRFEWSKFDTFSLKTQFTSYFLEWWLTLIFWLRLRINNLYTSKKTWPKCLIWPLKWRKISRILKKFLNLHKNMKINSDNHQNFIRSHLTNHTSACANHDFFRILLVKTAKN